MSNTTSSTSACRERYWSAEDYSLLRVSALLSTRFLAGWVPSKHIASAGSFLRSLPFGVPDVTPGVAGLLGAVVASVAMGLGIL